MRPGDPQGTCRAVSCDAQLPPYPGMGRPALYCSGPCEDLEYKRRRRQVDGAVELLATDGRGHALAAEVIEAPHDPHAWAEAHALLEGALLGRELSGSWAATDQLPRSGEVYEVQPPMLERTG